MNSDIILSDGAVEIHGGALLLKRTPDDEHPVRIRVEDAAVVLHDGDGRQVLRLDGATGDVKTEGGSLRFGNATAPMLYVFESGSMNPDRPIVAHSPRYPNWGLLYRDDGDKMIFQRPGSPALTVDLGRKRVGVGTDAPQHDLHVNGSAAGTQGFRTLSDGRCKTDVETLEGALETVQALRGVRFRWEEEACADLDVAEGPQVGLVAQEVAEAVPEAVHQGDDGHYTLDAGALVPILVEAVKALQAQVEGQAERLRQLESPVRQHCAPRGLPDDCDSQ